MTDKKECEIGYGCGLSCISKSRKCQSSLGETAKGIAANFVSFVGRIKEGIGGAVQAVKNFLNPPPDTFDGEPTQTPPKREDKSATLDEITAGNQGMVIVEDNLPNNIDDADFDAAGSRDPDAKIAALAKVGEERFGENLAEAAERAQLNMQMVQGARELKRLMKENLDNPDADPEDWKKLKEQLDKVKGASGNLLSDMSILRERIKNEFLEGSVLTEDGAKNRIKEKFGDEIAKPHNRNLMEGLAFVERMTNGSLGDTEDLALELDPKWKRPQAWTEFGEKELFLWKKNAVDEVAHEGMHIIESNDAGIATFSMAYVASRAGINEDTIVEADLLSNLTNINYGENEIAYPPADDRTIDPYMLKVYDVEAQDLNFDDDVDIMGRAYRATEVPSMMVQALFDDDRFVELMTRDPEGFKAFLGVMAAFQDKRHKLIQ